MGKKGLEELKKVIESDGGQVLAVYKEPFANKEQIFALLPIEKIKPAPFQREISTQHLRRLAQVIDKVGRYIDPIVVVRAEEGIYYTPNGTHRLEAMRSLGKDKITVILIPEPELASYILALNTEKSPNIKEKCLEVIKLYKELMQLDPSMREIDYAFQFEEASYLTLGIVYLEEERFSGATYNTFLKKVDNFLDETLEVAFEERKKRAQKVKELHRVTLEKEEEFKASNKNFPFLRQYIISKANPYKRLRKIDEDFYVAVDQLIENVKSLSPEKISTEEILRAGGVFE